MYVASCYIGNSLSALSFRMNSITISIIIYATLALTFGTNTLAPQGDHHLFVKRRRICTP